MLKTNSKQARENLKNYIIECARDVIIDERMPYHDGDRLGGYTTEEIRDSYTALCSAIMESFYIEKLQYNNRYQTRRVTVSTMWESWAQGLPSLGGLFDYYLSTAVETLGDILQETEAEKEKFTQDKAEKMLTSLLFREISNNSTYTIK